MLYLVGGAGNAERVDVSDLFARRIAARGFTIDYVIFGREATRAWEWIAWGGARAWDVGRAQRSGGTAGLQRNCNEQIAAFRDL
jgi:hypothetical protein